MQPPVPPQRFGVLDYISELFELTLYLYVGFQLVYWVFDGAIKARRLKFDSLLLNSQRRLNIRSLPSCFRLWYLSTSLGNFQSGNNRGTPCPEPWSSSIKAPLASILCYTKSKGSDFRCWIRAHLSAHFVVTTELTRNAWCKGRRGVGFTSNVGTRHSIDFSTCVETEWGEAEQGILL